MDGIYEQILDLARPYLDVRDNEEHTTISYDFAVGLLNLEGGNPKVVLPAIILHDIGWKHIPEDLHLSAFGPGKKDAGLNRVHEIEGAKTARAILEKLDYQGELVTEIVEIIEGHDSRTEVLSLNDAVVKDADKLWRYSQHGVEVDVRRFQVRRNDYLQRLQRKIDEWFFTRSARSMARRELQDRLREIAELSGNLES